MTTEYHKIQTVFHRDPENKFKTVLAGEWALPEFAYLQDNKWIFTEKVDGTNIRVIWNHELRKLKFAGKTDNSQIPPFLIDRLEELFPGGAMEMVFPDTSVCLYGEGYGAKIQKGGGNYRQDQSFVLFDVLIENWWLKREDVGDISKRLSIDVVPIIGLGTLHEMVSKVRDGFMSQWGNFIAEGIVAKPMVELKARDGSRIVTKLKHKDFKI